MHRDCAELLAVIKLQAPLADPAKTVCLLQDRVEYQRRSPGDELMTCSTSAVAVCRSSTSRVSMMSRAFSIAMTACAAKFCSSAICLSENGRTSWR